MEISSQKTALPPPWEGPIMKPGHPKNVMRFVINIGLMRIHPQTLTAWLYNMHKMKA
jgi:hypothetical protein